MQLTDRVHLVGSGAIGLSHPGDCHVYLVDGGSVLALVDVGCGEDTQHIVDNVAGSGFDPHDIHYLLLTHAHRDHAGGSAALKALLANVRVVASAAEARLLASGNHTDLGLNRMGLGDIPRAEIFPLCTADVILADGDSLTVGDLKFTTIEVPGHNPGCLCYLLDTPAGRALFSGDVIYPGGIISIGNWSGSDSQAYQRGLKKLAGLDVDMLFPGHLLWTLLDGQSHIDKANETFAGLWSPPNINNYL